MSIGPEQRVYRDTGGWMIVRIIIWLGLHPEKAMCQKCRAVNQRSQMVFQPGHGWFCTESEAYEWWRDCQW